MKIFAHTPPTMLPLSTERTLVSGSSPDDSPRPTLPLKPSRALVPVTASLPLTTSASDGVAAQESTPPAKPDVRHMTPRQMADLSLDLHIQGTLTHWEYKLLGFQPELHPNYDKTIGALTGEPAQPDRPRNYLRHWQERLDFERQHPSESGQTLAATERILYVLEGLSRPPTDIRA